MPDFFVTASDTAGWPLEAAYCEAGARARSMRATSPSRADTPGRMLDATGRPSSACGSVSTPLTLMDQAPFCVFRVPPEVSRHQADTVSATSDASSPRAASAWALGLISISGSRRPDANTWSTPPMRSRSSLMRRAFRRRVSSSAWPSSISAAVGKPLLVVISRINGSRASRGSSLAALF